MHHRSQQYKGGAAEAKANRIILDSSMKAILDITVYNYFVAAEGDTSMHGGVQCNLQCWYFCLLLPPFINIRCFSFVKQMYLDIF
jgi:hypothetical protein